jgi:PAS domain S-box-containing protein
MSDVHQQPEDSSGSSAEEHSSGIEERLAYYAHLEENSYDAFIATDENLLVKAWNRGAEMMYGIRAEEALGCDAREAVTLEISDEELASALREIAESGLRAELVQHREDGTPIYVASLTIAMRDEQGEITGYLAINRDITERKRAEAELLALTSELDAEVSAMSRLLRQRKMSHPHYDEWLSLNNDGGSRGSRGAAITIKRGAGATGVARCRD